jgi:hypothetical protein
MSRQSYIDEEGKWGSQPQLHSNRKKQSKWLKWDLRFEKERITGITQQNNLVFSVMDIYSQDWNPNSRILPTADGESDMRDEGGEKGAKGMKKNIRIEKTHY